MKICMLCYRANPFCGGQGIYLKYVAEAFARQGHKVHAVVGPPFPEHMEGVVVHQVPNNEYYVKKKKDVINPHAPFDIFNPLNFYQYFNSRFSTFPEISGFSYRAFLKIRELHRSEQFDVIHDNQCLGYGLLLMKSLGIPVVATIHHPLTIDLENVIERASSFTNKIKGVMFYPTVMQKIVSKRLDHVITVSEDSKEKIHYAFGVPRERQTVVYNGLDTSLFSPGKDVRKKKGKMIFVGNVEDGKKGFVYLLRALKHIKSDAFLTVIDGGAPHRKLTAQMIQFLGIENRVEFAGKVDTDGLIQHYRESELAIVPSVYEGFGFPAAEAMACGVPVIASDGGALPEVVGNAGIVVPSRDEKGMARAIDTAFNDRDTLQRMGNEGRARVVEMFNWDDAAARMITVFEKTISEKT